MSAFDNQRETEFCYGCQRKRLDCNHSQDGGDSETELTTCEVCGVVELPERIREHSCRTFLDEPSQKTTVGRDSVIASSEGDR